MTTKTHEPVTNPVTPEMLATIVAQAVAQAFKHVGPSGHVFASQPPVITDRKTVREVINEFIIAKATARKSDRYLRQARVVLTSFAKGRALRPITDLNSSDAEDWIFANQWAPPTQKRYFSCLRTVIRWAINKGYLARDFSLGIELPPDLSRLGAPEIHTPDQVRTVLEFAFGVDPDVGRHLAIRYFAGIRAAELFKLTEENVWTERGYIEVPPHVAKTRRRRLVKIEPNLKAWLALGGTLRPIEPDYIAQVRNASGVPYKANAPRKSFITYHVAMWENAARSALQAGHTEQMLFEVYKGLATQETAKEFWNIFPPSAVTVRDFKRKAHNRSTKEKALFAERRAKKLAKFSEALPKHPTQRSTKPASE